jgi:hypothetical protein
MFGTGEITMAESKMAEVASLFRKNLNEEFIIQDNFHYRAMAKFSEEGILVYHDLARKWLTNPYWLFELLTGEAVIVDD